MPMPMFLGTANHRLHRPEVDAPRPQLPLEPSVASNARREYLLNYAAPARIRNGCRTWGLPGVHWCPTDIIVWVILLGIIFLALWALHRHRQRQKEKRRKELGLFEQKRFSAHRPFILSAGGSVDSPSRLGLGVPAPLASSTLPSSPFQNASARTEVRVPGYRSSLPSATRLSIAKLPSARPSSAHAESSLVPPGTQPTTTLTLAVASTSDQHRSHRPTLSEPVPMPATFIASPPPVYQRYA